MGRFKKRTSRGLKLNKTVYIFSEGKTEEIYFKKLNQMTNKANIKIIPKEAQMSGLQLVQYATRAEKVTGSEVYIVFDKDQNSNAQIQQALSLASQNGYKVAFTNECFELWLVLHFESIVTNPLNSAQLYAKLNKNLSIKDYPDRKTDVKLIHSIAENFLIALKNNETLNARQTNWQNNPYSDISNLIRDVFIT